jgi:hypothetical protein
VNLRILPLFDGPAERPSEHFAIEHPEIVRALERMFRHWVETGCAGSWGCWSGSRAQAA